MKKNNFILIFLSIFLFNINASTLSKNFTINLAEKIDSINPLFWGTNFLFWIQDHAALQDGTIETSLKNMPCTILRYPGGAVADNFHWKTNMLDNAAFFPYEQGSTETNFDEFIAFCRRVNAEPLLVVNTQSWWIHNDMDGGAKEAADWVQYCKDKDYHVKYWEIGNETYLHPFMTAKEYGQVVKKYVRAMKAVDPTIKISANGHWNVDMVGTKERTTASEWENIRLKYLNATTRSDANAADAYANQFLSPDKTQGTDKWWNDVADECGDSIDMLSVHWYYTNFNITSMASYLDKIKKLFASKFPNHQYTMCMTEYNCNDDSANFRIANLFDGIGQFLNSGFDIGNFWPLTYSTTNDFRSMLTFQNNQEQYPYQILKLLSNNLKGDMINVTSSDSLIFPYASYDGKQLTVVVCGRSIKSSTTTVMNLSTLNQFTLMDAKAYDAPGLVSTPIQLVESDVSVVSSQTTCSFQLMPKQTVILRFKNTSTANLDTSSNKQLSYYYKDGKIYFNSQETVNATLYNLSGQVVDQQTSSGLTGLSVQAAGLYILKVDSKLNGLHIQKVLAAN